MQLEIFKDVISSKNILRQILREKLHKAAVDLLNLLRDKWVLEKESLAWGEGRGYGYFLELF